MFCKRVLNFLMRFLSSPSSALASGGAISAQKHAGHWMDGVLRNIADELINNQEDLKRAHGRFQYINIKLNKTGGLTTALTFADAAVSQGFGLMGGCMGGSSLSMAPAMILAQRCALVDFDSPQVDEQCRTFSVAANVADFAHTVASPHLFWD